MLLWPGVVAGISGFFLAAWWAWRRPVRDCECGRCRRSNAVLPRCILGGAQSQAQLEFRTGPMGGRIVVLQADRTAIGSVASDGQGDEIVLADPAVSQEHVLIERKGRGFVLRDLGSTNGTYINGLRHRTLVLCGDDIIRVGNSEAVFRIR